MYMKEKNIENDDIYQKITHRSLFGFAILLSIYCTSAAIAGLHGAKLLQLGALSFDAGLVTITLTFFVTDICSEVYGRKYSQKIVMGGLIALLISILTTRLAMSLPASPDWELKAEYDAIFGAGSRVLLAALVAFITSQIADITIFSWLKRATNGKHLWLRNNASTLIGGLFDALLFSTIAFYGTYPVLPIFLSAYAFRIAVSLIDTPFVYGGVWLFRKLYPELHPNRAGQLQHKAVTR